MRNLNKSEVFKNSSSHGAFNKIILYVFLIAYSIMSIFPVLFSIISSVKTDFDIFFKPFSLPNKIIFENYKRAWLTSHIGEYFKNSVVLAVSTCIILVITTSMAGYVMAKFKFKGVNQILVFFIAGMMIPIQSLIIPLSYDLGKLGMANNMLVVILMLVAFGISLNVLIYTGFMKSIPDEMEEAAIMDGCGFFKVYTSIIMPLSVPATVTVVIMNFLGVWNNFLIPLVFLNKPSMQPIATGLLAFFGEKQSDYSGVMAAIVISFVIPFIVYVVAQEKVEKGLTAGAVKG